MSVIGIVGPGRVGTALGQGWAAAGHQIRYGVRDPDSERHAEARSHGRVVAVGDAATDVDVVLLAVPWTGALDAAASLGDLGDTVVLDATNPLTGDMRMDPDAQPSAAHRIAGALRGGRLVKAFNTTGSGNMADADRYDPAPAMWLAGDDETAVAVASRLCRDVGFDPVVAAGGLAAAEHLEHLALLWIGLARSGWGADVVITMQTPG